jgi:seryl-tRNA synthetase
MKKSELIKLIRENYKNLSLKESKNKKKAVPYKSAKEIMDGIHEEAEAENKDSKASKIEQEIESIHNEIQNLYSSTVAGNVDSISNDIKYLLKQKEELEKENAKQIAELKVNYDNYINFSDEIANRLNVKASDLRYFVKSKWFENNK